MAEDMPHLNEPLVGFHRDILVVIQEDAIRIDDDVEYQQRRKDECQDDQSLG